MKKIYEWIAFVKISQKQHVFVRTKLIKTLKSNNPFHSLGLKVLVQERLSCYSIIREALNTKITVQNLLLQHTYLTYLRRFADSKFCMNTHL